MKNTLSGNFLTFCSPLTQIKNNNQTYDFFCIMAETSDVSITVPRPKLSWKTVLFPIVGVGAFFLYIYLFQVDIVGIIATARTADPLPYVAAAVLSIVEILFYALSWRVLINFLQVKISVIRSYLYVWYGIFIDTIIPAESVSGEAARIYLVQRDQGITSCGPTTASLVTHRLLGMALNVIVLFVGMGLLFIEGVTSGIILNIIFALAAGITAVLVLLIVFSFKEQWTLRVVNGVANFAQWITRGRWKRLAKVREDACRIASSFHDSMKKFGRNPRPLLASLLILGLTWLFNLGTTYLVFLALRTPVSWSMILITTAITLAVKAIPVGIPFEVGLPEITMTTFYTSFLAPTLGLQLAASISATATILSRLLTLWLRFFIGLGAQQYLDLKPVIKIRANDILKTQKT
ncbi:MAG TPA: lysylphosphatidylglycerol synthase transmembrane domain-containing protein [Candidatus Sulfotelmatobacter sp.]|nr:lysylphosphatidylglycerol synthase transmembrane domain-containing protein [Candidatus Sulfotelmatobacter sp.]